MIRNEPKSAPIPGPRLDCRVCGQSLGGEDAEPFDGGMAHVDCAAEAEARHAPLRLRRWHGPSRRGFL